MMPYSMKFAKNAKIKIKFQKNEGYFFGQHSLLKSHQPSLMYAYLYFVYMCNVGMFIDTKQRTPSMISLCESTTLLLTAKQYFQ